MTRVLAPKPLTMVRGRGAWLWDDRRGRHLDFFASACGLGHADARVARAVAGQAKALLLTSGHCTTAPKGELIREIRRRTFDGRVFFASSGAEANEGAIKLARRFGARTARRGVARHEIIVFRDSFHGRTLATLAATGSEKARRGLGPLPPGFKTAVFGDAASVRRRITGRTCAVMVEPIQGEGGVRFASPGFFRALRALCRRHRLLLIFDEVQTGMGRSGRLFAYQDPRIAGGVSPDVLTMGKGLANGLPIAATLARAAVADLAEPDDHGSTFAGGAVPCRAALVVMRALSPRLLSRVRRLGETIGRTLSGWREEFPAIREARGVGCMWAIELDRSAGILADYCRQQGLLVGHTSERLIRLSPPFCVRDADLRAGLAILRRGLVLASLTR